MKKIISIFCLTAALVSSAIGADVWFTWTPNPASEFISGYQIEYTKIPGVTNWTVLSTISGATNVAVVKGIQSGYKYQFRAFAVNAVGKGTDLSNIISIPTNGPSAVLDFSQTTPK